MCVCVCVCVYNSTRHFKIALKQYIIKAIVTNYNKFFIFFNLIKLQKKKRFFGVSSMAIIILYLDPNL